MTTSQEVLAWCNTNDSENFYSASDLKITDNVKEIFAACKASSGYVTAEGWKFLFQVWTLEEILTIDREVGWFHSGKIEETKAHLIYQSLMAGYNPISHEKGDYEADSGIFISLDGRKFHIDWTKFISENPF